MLHILSILSVVPVMVNVDRLEGCQCTPLAGTKYHFWIENAGSKRYIRIGDNQILLNGYRQNIHSHYLFATDYYRCPNKGGMYITTRIGSQYLANIDTTDQAADLVNHSSLGTLLCHDDYVMFKCTEGGGEELASLESFPSGNYLDISQSDGSVVVRDNGYFWISLPAVFADLTISSQSTAMTAGVNVSGIFDMHAVTRPQIGDQPKISVNGTPIEFEAISYRLCKSNANGSIVERTAIVLRSNQQEYIVVNITDDGNIPLPFGQGIDPTSLFHQLPVPFNFAFFKFYDDLARSNNSYIYKADIRDQRAIDERFFEVSNETDGTYRLLSTLHPDRYLAILHTDEGLKLVVAPFLANHSSIITYNFEMNITDADTPDYLEVKVTLDSQPQPNDNPWEVSTSKKADIIANLCKFMPPSRHRFWEGLPVSNANNLIDNFK